MEKKLGAGIITISILEIIFSCFSIIGSLILIFAGDDILELYSSMGIDLGFIEINKALYIALTVVSLALLVSSILILCKKSIGVYMFFTAIIINIISSIITAGFSFSIILSLILPGLMAYFIYKKKEVFNLSSDKSSESV